MPLSFPRGLVYSGENPYSFFPNEVLLLLKNSPRKSSLCSTQLCKAQELPLRRGADTVKERGLCGSHACWIWKVSHTTQWPLACRPAHGPDHSLLSSTTHLAGPAQS